MRRPIEERPSGSEPGGRRGEAGNRRDEKQRGTDSARAQVGSRETTYPSRGVTPMSFTERRRWRMLEDGNPDFCRAKLREVAGRGREVEPALDIVVPLLPGIIARELTAEFISVLRDHANRSFRGLSLTVPKHLHPDFRQVSAAYAPFFAAGERGAFLALDRRKDGSPHLHGVCVVHSDDSPLEQWKRITGADEKCLREREVGGWRHFVATKHPGSLTGNLRKALRYSLKPWPEGLGERDLTEDVWTAGCLADPWRAVRDGVATSGRPDPRDGLCGEPAVVQPSRATCLACGGPIPPGRRADARHCTQACRTRAWRARKGGAS